MENSVKWVIFGILIATIVCCLVFLFSCGFHDTAVFLAQSIIDNAIFCAMFIIVVLVTGINV